MTAEARIRPLRPSDHARVIAVIDEWWGGRPMAQMLPRLFFDHFTDTSFAAGRDGGLAGFLVGFVSPAQPGEAYIHFAGVDPGERSQGLGRRLYALLLAASAASAAGNREGAAARLGRALFISPKTASVHVSNILGKLGVSSRGEAAATAYRQHLLDDS